MQLSHCALPSVEKRPGVHELHCVRLISNEPAAHASHWKWFGIHVWFAVDQEVFFTVPDAHMTQLPGELSVQPTRMNRGGHGSHCLHSACAVSF